MLCAGFVPLTVVFEPMGSVYVARQGDEHVLVS